MRFPRLDCTTRGLMIAVILIGVNLAAALGTWECYPRPDTFPRFAGSRRHWANAPSAFLWPSPNPSLLRVWSPVITSLSISLAALWYLYSRKSLPRITPRRLAIAVPIVILSLPLLQMIGSPREDYHVHHGNRRSDSIVHPNPLWARYSTLLMEQSWPGNYDCPHWFFESGHGYSTSLPCDWTLF